MIKPTLKIILAVLSFLCLLDMPYNYYQFYRFAMFLLLAIIGYVAYKQKNYVDIVIAVVGVIFFNPFEKVMFIKSTWQIIDEALGFALLLWAIIDFAVLKYGKKEGI
jgi:hypothetical protein